MGNKRMYVGSAGVIAVVIFIYLGFFATNPTGEDVSGTINTVQKYQTDQISDSDVVLAGEEHIIDEMAELVDQATIEEQAELLGAVTKEMTVSFLGRVSKELSADIWGRMDKDDQVAAFNAMARQDDFLGRMSMTQATFKRMDRDKQAETLMQGATMEEKVAMFERSPQRAKLAAFERMDMQGRTAAMMQGANIREKAALMGRRPDIARQVLGRMDMQGRTDLVRTASIPSQSYMFNRAAELDKEAMMQGANVDEKAALFGRLEIQDQVNGVMGRVQVEKDAGFILGRASEAEIHNIFAQATPDKAREIFGRLSAEKQNDILGRLNMDAAAYGRMDKEKQAQLIQGANTRDKQDMLGKANFEEAYSLLGKMSLQNWQSYLGRMDKNEAAAAFGRVDKKIRMNALGRSPEIQASLLGRASAKTIDNVLARSFMDNTAVK